MSTRLELYYGGIFILKTKRIMNN